MRRFCLIALFFFCCCCSSDNANERRFGSEVPRHDHSAPNFGSQKSISAKNSDLSPAPPRLTIEDIKTKYGVCIKTDINDNFFPPDWHSPRIRAKAIQIEESELKRFPSVLDRALRRYPKTMINDSLKCICLAKNLSFFGIEYGFGGTRTNDSIYLSNWGVASGYTDQYLIDTFHKEFSSLFFLNHPFPKQQWMSINPIGFKYSDNSDSAGAASLVDKSAWKAVSHETYQGGFLSEYAKTSLENDFNAYSGMILGQPQKFYKLATQFTRIRKKYDLWIQFYRSVSDEFKSPLGTKL